MSVITSGPCPEPAVHLVVRATGHGFPADGQVIVTNTSAGLSHRYAMSVPMTDTFNGFAASLGIKLAGPYLVTFSCIDKFGSKTYATYTGTITFRDPTHFTATAPPSGLRIAANDGMPPIPPANGAPAPGAGGAATAPLNRGIQGTSVPAAAAPDYGLHRVGPPAGSSHLMIGLLVFLGIGFLVSSTLLGLGRRRGVATTRAAGTP